MTRLKAMMRKLNVTCAQTNSNFAKVQIEILLKCYVVSPKYSLKSDCVSPNCKLESDLDLILCCQDANRNLILCRQNANCDLSEISCCVAKTFIEILVCVVIRMFVELLIGI